VTSNGKSVLLNFMAIYQNVFEISGGIPTELLNKIIFHFLTQYKTAHLLFQEHPAIHETFKVNILFYSHVLTLIDIL
jgi:hypothetical protein